MDVRVEIIIKNTDIDAYTWSRYLEKAKDVQGFRFFLADGDEIRTSVIEDSWRAWDNGAEPEDPELAEELRSRERNLRY